MNEEIQVLHKIQLDICSIYLFIVIKEFNNRSYHNTSGERRSGPPACRRIN